MPNRRAGWIRGFTEESRLSFSRVFAGPRLALQPLRESLSGTLGLSGFIFMGAGYYNVHAARLQDAGAAARAAQTAPAPEAATAAEQRALLDKYCVTCHNQRAKTAGLMLDTVDIEHLGEAPETWEKVVRQLRAESMPPLKEPRKAAS